MSQPTIAAMVGNVQKVEGDRLRTMNATIRQQDSLIAVVRKFLEMCEDGRIASKIHSALAKAAIDDIDGVAR